MAPVISRWDRQQRQLRLHKRGLLARTAGKLENQRRLLRFLFISLAVVAILPPFYFHFYLRRLHQVQLRKCSWLRSPPLVCAHGGDSTKAFPNTMVYYLLFMTGRDLQRMSGNSTTKVGYLGMNEIADLCSTQQQSLEFSDVNIPTIEDALRLVSGSVRQVILDAKVGPPLYEKGLAKDILSIVERTKCKNCLIWAKSDSLARDLIKLSVDIMVGYIVMIDPSTGSRTNLLRMRGASVVGVYHPLIDEKLVKMLHGRHKKAYAWTVDEEDSMKNMLSESVDAIVTSNPTLLQRVMQDTRAQCLQERFSLSSTHYDR